MYKFTPGDLLQIENHGLDIQGIEQQICDFKNGFAFMNIVAPASIDNGIVKVSASDNQRYGQIYDNYAKSHNIIKFVPASGAATRMFKDLFDFVSSGKMNAASQKVINNIEKFAFYDKLQKHLSPDASSVDIISAIISNPGLNYGACPKAMILFHKYKGYNRTAMEEHLVEGFNYAKSGNLANIHFTVSAEHRQELESLVASCLPEYEKAFQIKYNITMSTQKNSTDTIAVTLDNVPFRDFDGRLLFRPAGHGALIENLNDLDADLIFIKNIDNVTTTAMHNDTTVYKKTIAGVLISLQEKIFDYLRNFESANMNDVAEFIKTDLKVKLPDKAQAADYLRILNRPLRVCGMVRNNGEPGGGPFWVRESDGTTQLQIIESSQISSDDMHLLKEATHFNPVDLVCGTKDYKGNKFDLGAFVDPLTGFISDKSKDGAPLRALERPGLWNGAMARWNTVFVDVPITTFAPVKTIDDLLRPQHMSD